MSPTCLTRRSLLTVAAAAIARPTFAAEPTTLTWYVSQTDAELAEAFGKAFTAINPDIRVEVVRVTGQVLFQRLQLDIKNNTPHCDVVSTSDPSHLLILKRRGELLEYKAKTAAELGPVYRELSDDGWYYVNDSARFVLVRNSERVPFDRAPKRWTDLLDPKWKGQIAMAHPAFSGGMGTWVHSKAIPAFINTAIPKALAPNQM